MKRQLVITLGAAILTIGTAFSSLAGQWNQIGNGWKYQNDDRTYAANGWHWIDGNNDGIAECYYFDSEGLMLANATTPDGYQVDGNGAWVQNGAVQTKNVGGQTGKNVQQPEQSGQNTEIANNNDAPAVYVTWKTGTTSFGFDWTTGTGSAGLPKFKKADGSYAANEWIRTDANGYDSYIYIFEDEYPRANAVTPDGRQTNEYGSWADAEGNTVYIKNGNTISDYTGWNTGNSSGTKAADTATGRNKATDHQGTNTGGTYSRYKPVSIPIYVMVDGEMVPALTYADDYRDGISDADLVDVDVCINEMIEDINTVRQAEGLNPIERDDNIDVKMTSGYGYCSSDDRQIVEAFIEYWINDTEARAKMLRDDISKCKIELTVKNQKSGAKLRFDYKIGFE